ncbi:M28 family metallopeptidase [Sphingomonas sp.]|uniref:M28 family metallopeptidase n=1 Tax=Sphingomonas sp. TaxID=28214 RepID=UPI00286C9C5A|nr:M28 family metallopeptidase [Sphingomonas sp.]
MNRLALFLATSTLAAASAIAAPPQFDAKRLSDHVRILGSDAYEGRGVATRAETKTVNYLVAQFRAAGLRPGGDLVRGKRLWTQAVPLLKSNFVGEPKVSLMLAGSKTLPLVQREQIALRSPMNGSKAVNIAGAPLVFVGYGVTAPERGWDDFKDVDVKGKILVLLINDPDFEGPADADFGGKAMTYYGRWTYKYEEAARRGAAGVMLVHETAPAAYGWNTVKNSNTNTMFDIVRDNPPASHTGFESWIQRDAAQAIFAAAGLDFDKAKADARRKDFRPIDLKATLDASATATTSVITSHNVAGMLRGKTRPNETLIYSAHWDHLGIGQPDAKGDRNYNGAVDNGTGLAQLIAQARAFGRAPRTDRSILFLAVTAEEKGLLGSEYYGTHPLYPLGTTVGMLNTDSMGVHGSSRDFSISGSAKLGLLDDLIEEAAKRGRRFTPDPHPEAGHFYRSDHFTLAKVGVPAISFDSGNDLVNGGTARGEELAKDYVTRMYHQPADEWQSNWDFSGIVADAQLLHALGLRLANSREWPNWSQDSEFRAARDKTAVMRR